MKRPQAAGSCFAIYTRQSTEPTDGISSCEAQFHTCMDFVVAESGTDTIWLGERFDDEGVSGRTLDRPALNRLRDRVSSSTSAYMRQRSFVSPRSSLSACRPNPPTPQLWRVPRLLVASGPFGLRAVQPRVRLERDRKDDAQPLVPLSRAAPTTDGRRGCSENRRDLPPFVVPVTMILDSRFHAAGPSGAERRAGLQRSPLEPGAGSAGSSAGGRGCIRIAIAR